MRLGWLGWGLIGLLAVAGCTSSARDGSPSADEAPTATREDPIQGGSDTTAYTYAVGLCLGQKGSCQGICSGTLIAPNLVLTARHCVRESPPRIECGVDTFGSLKSSIWVTTYHDVFQGSQGWHQAVSVSEPPDLAFCGNDIALLFLEDNVPASEAKPVEPGVPFPMTDHSRYSTTVTAIGFGNTSVNGNDAGKRRIRERLELSCIPGDAVIPCPDDPRISKKEFFSASGTCGGDSGSGAFEQTTFTAGAPVVMGVLSRGGENQQTGACIGGAYTRADAWVDLIQQAGKDAAQMGGYPVPAWATRVLPPELPDGGTATDAGSSSLKANGQACTAPEECQSKSCVSQDGSGFVCATGCDLAQSGVCGAGFSCVDIGGGEGYCFKDAGDNDGLGADPDGGCHVGLLDPTRPVPWKIPVTAAAVFGLLLRRRRRPHPRASDDA